MSSITARLSCSAVSGTGKRCTMPPSFGSTFCYYHRHLPSQTAEDARPHPAEEKQDADHMGLDARSRFLNQATERQRTCAHGQANRQARCIQCVIDEAMAATPPEPPPSQDRDHVAGWAVRYALDRIIGAVAELPDRTSPDDWPDAMLVTADELRAIVRAEIDAMLVPALPEPLPSQERPDRYTADDTLRTIRELVADKATLQARLTQVTEERDAMTAARDKVRASFGHKDGKCQCPYCQKDFEALAEHAADMEWGRHKAIEHAEALESQLQTLRAQTREKP